MTKPLREAVKLILAKLEEPKRVLEIGSRQAENQNDIADLRELLPKSKFIGVDMIEGPGVDVVANAEKLPFANSSFDLIVCLETLEHAEKPWIIANEIERLLSKKGVTVVSSQQNFPIHLHPSDYFRYTPFGLKNLFGKLSNSFVLTISPPFENEVKLNPQHVVLVGTKNNDSRLLKNIKKHLTANKAFISVHKPYRHRVQDTLKFFRRGLQELGFRQEIEFF